MPTNKPRLNISLKEDVRAALAKAAHLADIPQATKAAQLLETALELEEDQTWDELAAKRDSKHANFISHDKAWK